MVLDSDSTWSLGAKWVEQLIVKKVALELSICSMLWNLCIVAIEEGEETQVNFTENIFDKIIVRCVSIVFYVFLSPNHVCGH